MLRSVSILFQRKTIVVNLRFSFIVNDGHSDLILHSSLVLVLSVFSFSLNQTS